MHIQTHVNGKLEQSSSTADLIFSIPELIATLSAGQTLQPGDVLATGTPAGVGIGKTPPVFLQPGDEISISVTGLGTLTNKVAAKGAINPTLSRIARQSSVFEATNNWRTRGRRGCLTTINGKPMSYTQTTAEFQTETTKSQAPHKNIVFVHGLGATKDFWTALISPSPRFPVYDNTVLHTYDLEGHGLTPSHALHRISIASLAADLAGVVLEKADATAQNPVHIIAHGLGCLVALKFAAHNPDLVWRLDLLGPPPLEVHPEMRAELFDRAALVRAMGMHGVVEDIIAETLTARGGETKKDKANPLVEAAVRLTLLSQDPEGYAKGLEALARCSDGDGQGLSVAEAKKARCTVLFNTRSAQYGLTSEQIGESWESWCDDRTVHVGLASGYWMVFENVEDFADIIGRFGSTSIFGVQNSEEKIEDIS